MQPSLYFGMHGPIQNVVSAWLMSNIVQTRLLLFSPFLSHPLCPPVRRTRICPLINQENVGKSKVRPCLPRNNKLHVNSKKIVLGKSDTFRIQSVPHSLRQGELRPSSSSSSSSSFLCAPIYIQSTPPSFPHLLFFFLLLLFPRRIQLTPGKAALQLGETGEGFPCTTVHARRKSDLQKKHVISLFSFVANVPYKEWRCHFKILGFFPFFNIPIWPIEKILQIC